MQHIPALRPIRGQCPGSPIIQYTNNLCCPLHERDRSVPVVKIQLHLSELLPLALVRARGSQAGQTLAVT